MATVKQPDMLLRDMNVGDYFYDSDDDLNLIIEFPDADPRDDEVQCEYFGERYTRNRGLPSVWPKRGDGTPISWDRNNSYERVKAHVPPVTENEVEEVLASIRKALDTNR